MTCENSVVTSNLFKKSSQFCSFLKPANLYFPVFCELNRHKFPV